MTTLLTTEGQPDLPRYFGQVMKVLEKLRVGRMEFVLPDGRRFRAEGAAPGPVAEVQVKNPDVFARLIREGDLGFCDAYLDGDWDTPDLQAFMDLVQAPPNNGVNDGFPGMGLVRSYERMRHWLRGNSKRQAKRNIAYHYDLGNDFYRLWLDDTMTYSSALFRSGQESLEAAQEAKYASMLQQMGARRGDHLLEIGCGWGGFAEHAARAGMGLTCLTISKEQHDFAQARIARAGLSDRVEIRLQDYRDERGQYDGIASIEMFEAVGEKYWPVYFGAVRDRLKPGRNATLQIITVPDARFAAYRKTVDFIQKYIFPGGMLPSPAALAQEVAAAGLALKGHIEFGESYSQTLRRWHDTFNAHWPEVRALGFDDRFRRMWNFYLTSCAGAFHGGNCDVTQITVTRPG
ncbi:SAM-dependent methyltransferase [Gemmobacter nanjingensis]|uniref:SAM-dependent methyltransferase n=1 Tax=Gemmobacter nanjingensis TaxID=488454 RepID=UPI001674CE23|nr:cyclopropane-fatty-acyl-phospholipid synthase family protein [Gemmobacter nanjingensis]